MGVNFWWIYDIAFLAVLILCIYSSAKKGFSKIIIIVIGCVVSVLLSSVISQYASPAVYDNFVKKSSIKAVEKSLEDYSPAMSIKEALENEDYGAVMDEGRVRSLLQSDDSVEMLYEYTNQAAGEVVDTHDNYMTALTAGFADLFSKQLGVNLPPYVVREITQKMSGNDKLFVETTKLLVKSPDKVPEYIEENYIREPALKLVRAFVFIICYFIIMMLIRVVVYKTVKFGLLNGYDRLDRIVGGLFGAVQAAAVIIILAVLVKIMIQIAESDGSLISYETVDQTKFFRHVFNYVDKY